MLGIPVVVGAIWLLPLAISIRALWGGYINCGTGCLLPGDLLWMVGVPFLVLTTLIVSSILYAKRQFPLLALIAACGAGVFAWPFHFVALTGGV